MYFLPGNRSVADHNSMFIPARIRGNLLDVGCGNGGLLRHLQGLGWQVEGIDIDPVAVESARKRGFTVHRGTLMEQKYPDNKFDAITMSHLIEHVPQPAELLRECFRILKPCGQVVIVTPNADSFLHRVFKANCMILEPPRHLHIFTISGLRRLVKESGFRNVQVTTSIRIVDYVFATSFLIMKNRKHISDSTQPRWLRMVAACARLLAWVMSLFNRYIGEEIVVVAAKGGNKMS